MPRKRVRDWPTICYKFDVLTAEIPDIFWDIARKQQALWNALCDEHKAVREQINDQTSDETRKQLWDQFGTTAQTLVKTSGLNWVVGPDVLDLFTKACVAAAKSTERGWPHPRGIRGSLPHRYTGGGSPIRVLFGSRATRLRLMPLPRRKPGDQQFAHGVFGLGDDQQIQFTCVLHRPIPQDAILKNARWVGTRTAAFGWEWALVLTVEAPVDAQALSPAVGTGTSCGIDLGWRKRDDALRVGYLVDSQGQHREFLLSLDFGSSSGRKYNRFVAQRGGIPIPQNHADVRALQQTRSVRFDQCKEAVALLLETKPPGWERMRERGLYRLYREWLAADAHPEACALIAEWHEWDRPRLRRQTAAEARFERIRRERYRLLAKEICMQYETIYVEQPFVKKAAEAEEKSAALEAADRNRQIAAPASFILYLRAAARRLGCTVIERDLEGTTAICCQCGGHVERGPALLQTCVNGHTMDPDANAATNLVSKNWPDAERKTPTGKKRKVGKRRDPAAVE